MGFVGTEVVLRDILEEHLETLDLLWTRRRASLRSAALSYRDLVDHDERIAAHSDGLVLAGPDGIAVVRDAVASDEGSLSLAAGYVLLAMSLEEATQLVREALPAVGPPALDGLRIALCHGNAAALEPELRQALAQGPEPLAAVAAEALVFHGRLAEPPPRVASFAASADPVLRRAAWRIAALASSPPGAPPPRLTAARDFERAAGDSDPAVRALALEAAAWTRQPSLLDHCRRAARAPAPGAAEAIHMLAVLGGPEDLALMRAVGCAPALGPRRFDLLASFGHPGVLDLLVGALEGSDPAEAAAAAAAFQRITGVDVGSGRREPVLPPGAAEVDAFDREFLDEVEVPDPALARAALERPPLGDQLARATRLAGGHALPATAPRALLDQLDLRSRWEGALRAAYMATGPVPSAADLERFPSPQPGLSSSGQRPGAPQRG